MKIAIIIVRILMGALFVFASLAYWFQFVPQPEVEGALKRFNEGLDAARYLMPLVKGIELVCGIALLSGRFVPLATVLLFPISLNILLVHVFLAPEGLLIAGLLLLGNLFLAYACRHHYRGLFAAKI